MRMLRSLLLGLVFFVHAEARAATIESAAGVIKITGEIIAGDFDKLLQVVSERSEIWGFDDFEFVLNSPGGDVEESMKIAEFARDMWTTTEIIPARASYAFLLQGEVTCDSACVLIFIAGTDRRYIGYNELPDRESHPLGLHRPYFSPKSNAALSPGDAELAYKQLEEDYRAAMARYGATEEFIERTFRTGSANIDRVSSIEFYNNYFPIIVPWLDEYMQAKCPGLSYEETMYLSKLTVQTDLGEEAKRQKDSLMTKNSTSYRCRDKIAAEHRTQVFAKYVK